MAKPPLHDRFLAAITYEPNTGCWLWCAATTKPGYGVMNVSKSVGLVTAHRYSYEYFKGKITDGLHVLHSCDQPSCCNPSHLRVGTPADNAADRGQRGRDAKAHPNAQGELNHNAKLTEDAVRDIRSARLSVSAFSRLYGVSRKAVQRAMERKSWAYVE